MFNELVALLNQLGAAVEHSHSFGVTRMHGLFPNQFTLSAVYGPGTYTESWELEIAVFKADNEFAQIRRGDQVIGHLTEQQVMTVARWLVELEPGFEITPENFILQMDHQVNDRFSSLIQLLSSGQE